MALNEALGDAPVSTRVRAALLRASAENPKERWPTMGSLLSELEPKSRRGPLAVASIATVAIAAVCVVALFAIDRMSGSAAAIDCSAIEAKWERTWNSGTASAIKDGLVATKRSHAARYAARVSKQLDRYGESWRDARTLSCSEKQPRRSRCLDRQLARIEVVVSRLQNADQVTADRALDLARAALDGGGCEAPETWPKERVDQDEYLAIARVLDEIALDRMRGEHARALEVAARVAGAIDGTRMPRLAAELAMHRALAGGSGEPDGGFLTPNERAELALTSPGVRAADLRRHIDALQRADAPSRLRRAGSVASR